MNAKVVPLFVGVLAALTAADQTDHAASGNDVGISSSDSFSDVVRKLLPSMIHQARSEGGSITDKMNRVNMAFIPMARTLVTLKAMDGQINDPQRAMADIEGAERILILLSNFMKNMQQLADELPADWIYRPKSNVDQVNEISNIGLDVAGQITGNQHDVEIIRDSLNPSMDLLLSLTGPRALNLRPAYQPTAYQQAA